MTALGAPSTLRRRIGVCIAISDLALAQRITTLLSGDNSLDVAVGLDDGCDPDVILVDGIHGLPRPSIIIDDDAPEPDPSDADIRAVLSPSIDGELLRAAIRVVAAGFMISHAHEARSFSGDSARLDRSLLAEEGEIALTAREQEVLGLLAHGASNKLIARALGISVHTAKFHIASVVAKLGARNRSDALALAIRRGLLLL